jgi:hypothetical protein
VTLIAALIPDGHPVLLGDLLISADLPKDGALPVSGPVFLPSVGLTVPPDLGASRQIVATRQKLCLITDNLAVGWSGPYLVAQRIVRAMLDHFPSGPLTMADIDEFFTTWDYDDLYRSGLSLVGSCFNNETMSNFSHNATEVDLPLFGVSYVGGEGSRPFIDLCQSLGPHEADAPASDNTLSRALAKTLLVHGTLLGEEILWRKSLDVHFFGGFYETVLRFEPGLRKIGDVAHVYWQLNVDRPNNFRLRLLLFIKLDYVEDVLIIRRIQVRYDKHQPPNRDDNTLIVSPLYRDVSIHEVEGKWLLDMNATHYCHLVLVLIDDRLKFLVIPEVASKTRNVVVTEGRDGTQLIEATDDFINRVVEQVVRGEGL